MASKQAPLQQAHDAPVRDLPSAKWSSVLLGLWLSLVALFAVPDAIQPGDAGEFATVMLRGGVPHPSGYPWMRVLGVFARGLEALGVPPAKAAALPCALLGVAGWVLLQRCALRLLGTRVPAQVTSVLVLGGVATSPLLVRHTADSEVWGPLVFFAALVVHVALSAAHKPLRLGFVFGLAVSHHLSASLLLPLVVIAAWPARLEARALLRVAGLGIAGGLLGLLPYATLALGSGDAWRWGDTQSLEGLAWHVSRGDYGVFSLSLHHASVPPRALLERSLASLGDALSVHVVHSWGAGLALVLLVVAGGIAYRPAPARARWGLAVTAIGSGVGFALAHNIDPRSAFGAWILERFDILPLTLLAVLEACACMLVLGWLRRPLARRLLAPVALVLLARQQNLALRFHAPSTNGWIERYALDVLRTPDPGRRALVFGTDDHRSFAILYAQEVLGRAPQVVYIDASLLGYGWYRERVRAQLPELPPDLDLSALDKPVRFITYLWRDPAWRQTPMYLANVFSRPAATLHRVPEGLLWRLVPPGEADAFGPAQVAARHADAWARYPRALPPPTPSHPFARDVWSIYQRQAAVGHDADLRATPPEEDQP